MPDFTLRLGFLSFNRMYLFPLLLLWALAVFALVWLEKRRVDGADRVSILSWGVILAAIFGGVFGIELKHDEVEHLHSTWLMSQGSLPFLDFWQHHSPLLWIVLAPVMNLMPAGIATIDFFRAFAVGTSLTAGVFAYRLARRLNPNLPFRGDLFAALVSGLLIISELNILRPDLIGNVLILSALLSLNGELRFRGFFLFGLFNGLAMALSFKFIPFVVAPTLVLLFERRSLRELLGTMCSTILGLLAGLAPLALWLWGKGLLAEFHTWVWVFNLQLRQENLLGGELPIIPIAMVAAWFLKKSKGGFAAFTRFDRIALLLMLLSMVTFSTQTTKYDYNLQVFFLMAFSFGAVEAESFLRWMFRERHWALLALLLSTFFFPSFFYSCMPIVSSFEKRHEVLSNILELSRGETVLLVPPCHPIFVRDATDLSHAGQLCWVGRPLVKKRLLDIDHRIMTVKPRLILGYLNFKNRLDPDRVDEQPVRSDFVEYLQSNGTLDASRSATLEAFIEKHYRLTRIGSSLIWVRFDQTTPVEAGP